MYPVATQFVSAGGGPVGPLKRNVFEDLVKARSYSKSKSKK